MKMRVDYYEAVSALCEHLGSNEIAMNRRTIDGDKCAVIIARAPTDVRAIRQAIEYLLLTTPPTRELAAALRAVAGDVEAHAEIGDPRVSYVCDDSISTGLIMSWIGATDAFRLYIQNVTFGRTGEPGTTAGPWPDNIFVASLCSTILARLDK